MCSRISPPPCAGRLGLTDHTPHQTPMSFVQGRAAQALVESALVLPLVVTLSLGVLQVVLYAHAHDVLTSAVQEGARLAAEDGRRLDEGYARAEALVRAGLGTSV